MKQLHTVWKITKGVRKVINPRILEKTRMFDKLITAVKLTILSVDFHTPGVWWNYKGVNSPYSRLYYVTDGEAYVTHGGKKHHLKSGRVVLVPAFTTCDLHCPDKFTLYHINFTAKLSTGVDLFSTYDYNYSHSGTGEELTFFKKLMELNPEHRLESLNPHCNLNCACNKEFLLSDNQNLVEVFESDAILRMLLVPFLKTASEPQKTRKMNKRLCDVFLYIDKNLSRHIKLKELAGVLCLNPTYFSNIFHEMTGSRPTEYIATRRIEMAQRLLLSTAFSIKELADQLGFSSASHFSHTFKKQLGISPQQYRQHHEII